MRLLTLIILLPFLAHGQSHHEFWSKINITKQLNSRWDVGVDLQFRQQSNFKTGGKDIFHYPMTRSIRNWAYFHLENKWTLVISPMAFFVSDEILNNSGDFKKTKEIRFIGGIMKAFQLNRIKLNNRFLGEHRIIDISQPEQFSQWRYRIQNAFTLQIYSYKRNTEINYIIANEFFLKSQSHKISFDQERLLNSLQWKFKYFDIDAGYQWTIQKGNTSTQHRNQWMVMTNFII